MALDADADVRMPLTAHLDELRSRLIRALLAAAVGFVVAYQFIDPLFALLVAPLTKLRPDQAMVIGTGVAEAFFTKLKVAGVAGLFVSSPLIFYQLWQFVAPGMYSHEKKLAIPFAGAASFFFIAGAVFCYVVVFPVAFAFFLDEYQSIGVAAQIRVSEYLSFSSRMLLGFGVTFELPVATFFLARVGLVTHTMLMSSWRYAIVIIFIVAAVLTPGPDVASQMLMATPLLILYGLSIFVAYFFAVPRKAAAPSTETSTDLTPTDDD